MRSASSSFSAAITADGSTIVYSTRTATGTGTATQFFSEPFGGGASHAVTPPLDQISNGVLASDGKAFVVATPNGTNGTRLTSYNIASGASNVIADLSGTPSIFAAGADRIVMIDAKRDSITVINGAGKVVGGFAIPDSVTAPDATPSPDGNALALVVVPRDLSSAWGSDQNLHIPIDRATFDGKLTPITVAHANTINNFWWITGGMLWWLGNDASDQRMAIYRVPITGGDAKRGEPLPFPDGCTCTLSADGSRGTAVVAKPLTDVWVITNFRQR